MEINAIIEEKRTAKALTSNIPNTVERIYEIGNVVLVYREEPEKWLGPFIIVTQENNLRMNFNDGNEQIVSSKQKVKPHYRQSTRDFY